MREKAEVLERVSLRRYTTLRAGGAAERFIRSNNVDHLAELAVAAQLSGQQLTVLGGGSNVLPSDAGVPGLVVLNACTEVTIERTGEVIADVGVCLQELFLRCAQIGLAGFEHAVGIPGTLGGALVSNAGAYRNNVSTHLVELEVVEDGRRMWVSPEWMKFSYRDSKLRQSQPPRATLLRARWHLLMRDPSDIYADAKEFQRQRIRKQPPQSSAGSFFKNVVSRELAQTLPGLPDNLAAANVIPAGYLIEHCGLSGKQIGGAKFSPRHANFIINVGGSTATAIRDLAELAKSTVESRFGIELEEEVLYLGDWSSYRKPDF